MKLLLICNEKKIYEGEISQIDIETANGRVTILPRHQPYMAKIFGSVSYMPDGTNAVSIDITEGFIYTDGTTCFTVVDQ